MKEKDYEPIRWDFFQTDIEKMLNTIQEAITICERDAEFDPEDREVFKQLTIIKQDWQHKIEWNKIRGLWK